MTVGIQGGKGSFNEQAMQALQERGDIEAEASPHYLYTTQATLKAVEDRSVEYGLLAIYNSKSQLVAESSAVIGHFLFDVVTSITIPIQHHMMMRPDKDVKDISSIMGHEEAFAQCTNSLKKRFPELKTNSGEGNLKDGAGVARALKDGQLPPTTAVLGSEVIATTFDLKVVASNLADDPHNTTTFLLVKNFQTS